MGTEWKLAFEYHMNIICLLCLCHMIYTYIRGGFIRHFLAYDLFRNGGLLSVLKAPTLRNPTTMRRTQLDSVEAVFLVPGRPT